MSDRLFLSLAAALIVFVIGFLSVILVLVSQQVEWAPWVLAAAIGIGAAVFIVDLATDLWKRRRN